MCGACAQAAAARAARDAGRQANRGGSPTPGLLATNPLVIGEPSEGGEITHVRVNRTYPGLVRRQKAYVTGQGVAALLGSGTFVLLDTAGTRGRMWRVGAFTYQDYDEAVRVGEATGLGMPVEVV